MGKRHVIIGALLVAVWLSAEGGRPLTAQDSADGNSASQNPPIPPTSLPTRIDPKAQELLSRCVQLLGGDAFMTSKTLTTRGRSFSISDSGSSIPLPFVSYMQFPDKRRISYGKTNPVILVNDADQQWELDRDGLTDQLPAQIYNWKLYMRFGFENFFRVFLKQPGLLIQPGGVDFVDNVPTISIVVFESQGVTAHLDLNRITNLPVRISYKVRNPKTGDADEYEDVYSDYRKIQGINTPMNISRILNGDRVAQVFRNSAQYNESYPPEYFQPTR